VRQLGYLTEWQTTVANEGIKEIAIAVDPVCCLLAKQAKKVLCPGMPQAGVSCARALERTRQWIARRIYKLPKTVKYPAQIKGVRA